MARMIDDRSTGSLFQRALAEAASNADTRAESWSAARVLSSKSVETWDPWEVWLRYIERPHRLRDRPSE